MHKITLVYSVHRENGLCNPQELQRVLRDIDPEVIFAEFRPSEFDRYYKHGNLEAVALTMLRNCKSFQMVPVDTYHLPTNLLLELKRAFDAVLDCVTELSHEYELLNQENDNHVSRGGFQYLNSSDGAAMLARIAEVEERTIIATGNQDLICALASWRSFMQNRELEMVSNIYGYCKEHAFGNGALLVGAAHQNGIVGAIERYRHSEAHLIDWAFAYAGARN